MEEKAHQEGSMTGHEKLVELRLEAERSMGPLTAKGRFDQYILVRVTRTIKLPLGVTWKKGTYLICNPASTAYGKARGFNFMAAWNQKNLCDSRVPANAVEAVMLQENVDDR
jgi:hypothetical protein